MNDYKELISKCQNNAINGKLISKSDASKLFNIEKSFLSELTTAANSITRQFHGSKVDVEELTNIKKNYCSEDCSFCSQSAFFNTKIDDYQLPEPAEIVKQAKKAKNESVT